MSAEPVESSNLSPSESVKLRAIIVYHVLNTTEVRSAVALAKVSNADALMLVMDYKMSTVFVANFEISELGIPVMLNVTDASSATLVGLVPGSVAGAWSFHSGLSIDTDPKVDDVKPLMVVSKKLADKTSKASLYISTPKQKSYTQRSAVVEAAKAISVARCIPVLSGTISNCYPSPGLVALTGEGISGSRLAVNCYPDSAHIKGLVLAGATDFFINMLPGSDPDMVCSLVKEIHTS